MTIIDSILPAILAARGKAGEVGIRLYTVELCNDYYPADTWSGPITTPVVEGGGYPPKVKRVTDQAIPVGAQQPNVWDIGPITPPTTGGGTDLTEWLAPVAEGETRHVILTGPEFPDGERFRVISTTVKATGYKLRVQAEREAMQGFGGAL